MRRRHALIVAALVLFTRAGGAQGDHDGDGITARGGRANATRAELERLAAEADTSAARASSESVRQARRAEAAALRRRLAEGDMRAGDLIVLSVHGDTTMSDTVEVLPGPAVRVLSLPDDTLRGVLRSELQANLTAWITHFYKNTSVRATPLIRFGVLGEVTRPGYYRVPGDIAVTDVIMMAGGPTPRADMQKAVVRRSAREVLSRAEVGDAITGGATLEQLGLDAGDVLVIATKPERNWIAVASVLTGVIVSLTALHRF